MSYITLSIYDYGGKKLCDLYDSRSQSDGQAYDIMCHNEISGWKEISFTIPYKINNMPNFRWDYIKNERQLRYTKDGYVDWYIVNEPSETKNGKATTSKVACGHISSNQKTKNLYLVLDDENGIGTQQYLAVLALQGTGWSLGDCDMFYESDGVTEKVRSIKSDGKIGAYQLITNICNMFNAYPIYEGDVKKVSIHCLNHRRTQMEMHYGKNLSSIERKRNSNSIITRLYVEGEYGDYGYVGIDNVNPNGLSFLQNFDYYRDIGVFTFKHQSALDDYLVKIASAKNTASTIVAEKNTLEAKLNSLWGQISYVHYTLSAGNVTKIIHGGSAIAANDVIVAGDTIAVLHNNNTYTLYTVPENGVFSFGEHDKYAVKYITRAAGIIGGKEVAVEAKEKTIASIQSDLENEKLSESKRAELLKQVKDLQDGITLLHTGDTKNDGLYELFYGAVQKVIEIDSKASLYESAMDAQSSIESSFCEAMGDMLKDGYWSDDNYAPGQEQTLYNDAIELMGSLSKPSVTYTVGVIMLSRITGYEAETFDLNTSVRLYDEDIGINDYLYVSKIQEYPENASKNTIELSNEYLKIQGKTFDSVLTRITQLADILQRKKSVYDRSEAISTSGSLTAGRLEGSIDVMRTKILSSVSSWYTDENGNIIFESVNGLSAMMMCGEGFMIANGKTSSGSWNWRTFGTGDGFTADAIIAGFLSADRIESHSITVNKLSSDVGQSLDLSSNNSIIAIVKNAVGYHIEIDGGGYISSSSPTTTLAAKVFQGNDDVTNNMNANRFNWKRVSDDTSGDLKWNDGHKGVKMVVLARDDVLYHAEFTCEFTS